MSMNEDDDLEQYDVCHCGDFRRSHPNGIGPCGYCAQSTAPYDSCAYFRFARYGQPIPLRRREDPIPPPPTGAMS